MPTKLAVSVPMMIKVRTGDAPFPGSVSMAATIVRAPPSAWGGHAMWWTRRAGARNAALGPPCRSHRVGRLLLLGHPLGQDVLRGEPHDRQQPAGPVLELVDEG